LKIGLERIQAPSNCEKENRQSKSLVRPWIEEDDYVRIKSAKFLTDPEYLELLLHLFDFAAAFSSYVCFSSFFLGE
jgi:hypothetical protein